MSRAISPTHFQRNLRGKASSRAVDCLRLIYLTSSRCTSSGSRKISREFAGKRAARSKACPRVSSLSAIRIRICSYFRDAFSFQVLARFQIWLSVWNVRSGFSRECDCRYDLQRALPGDNEARAKQPWFGIICHICRIPGIPYTRRISGTYRETWCPEYYHFFTSFFIKFNRLREINRNAYLILEHLQFQRNLKAWSLIYDILCFLFLAFYLFHHMPFYFFIMFLDFLLSEIKIDKFWKSKKNTTVYKTVLKRERNKRIKNRKQRIHCRLGLYIGKQNKIFLFVLCDYFYSSRCAHFICILLIPDFLENIGASEVAHIFTNHYFQLNFDKIRYKKTM